MSREFPIPPVDFGQRNHQQQILVQDVGIIDVVIQPTSLRPLAVIENEGDFEGSIEVQLQGHQRIVQLIGDIRDKTSRSEKSARQRPVLAIQVNRLCDVQVVAPESPNIVVEAGVDASVSVVVQPGQRLDLSQALPGVKVVAVIWDGKAGVVSTQRGRWLPLDAVAPAVEKALGSRPTIIGFELSEAGHALTTTHVGMGDARRDFVTPLAAHAHSISTAELTTQGL